jgi:hypothetical protein
VVIVFSNAGPPFAPFGGITRIRFKGFHGKYRESQPKAPLQKQKLAR